MTIFCMQTFLADYKYMEYNIDQALQYDRLAKQYYYYNSLCVLAGPTVSIIVH